ncbi:hypothetical protein ACOTVP_08685 [Aliarcobacter butzleri]
MNYEELPKEELILLLKDKDKEISDLETENSDKEREIENLEATNSDLECKVEEYENLKYSGEIKKQIDILTTDEVADIYYYILDSHHSKHLDKFKSL